MKYFWLIAVAVFSSLVCPMEAENILITRLDPQRMQAAGDLIAVGCTLDRTEIKIAGKLYSDAITVQAGSDLCFLRGVASRLQGAAGVINTSPGGAMFKIYGDTNVLWASGGVAMGATPQSFDLDLSGAALVRLVVEGDPDTTGCWLDTTFVCNGNGVKPQAVYNPATYESLAEWENPRVFRVGAEPSTAKP